MPTLESSTRIQASPAEVFEISQDYALRREWDPFTRDMRFPNGETEAGVGVAVWVLGDDGRSMTVRITTFDPPRCVAMTMVQGPWVFTRFAGSWRFEALGEGGTRVRFRYGFQCRRGLGGVVHPIVRWRLAGDIRRRLAGLKGYVEGRTARGRDLEPPRIR